MLNFPKQVSTEVSAHRSWERRLWKALCWRAFFRDGLTSSVPFKELRISAGPELTLKFSAVRRLLRIYGLLLWKVLSNLCVCKYGHYAEGFETQVGQILRQKLGAINLVTFCKNVYRGMKLLWNSESKNLIVVYKVMQVISLVMYELFK